MLLSPAQIDAVLGEYCDQVGVEWSDMHDEAFCVQRQNGGWIYIWYDSFGSLTSKMLTYIEQLINDDALKIKQSKTAHIDTPISRLECIG